METYNGHVRTPADAIILFEACRVGLLPRVQRRLSEKERQSIRSGSVFVWDEREAGMRRWTDGKSWSASRVSGSFLTYREMEGKRGGTGFAPPVPSRGGKTPESTRNSGDDRDMDGEEGPDGYRYKPDGLMKQSFSITTSSGQHLHLISYYSRSHPNAAGLPQPTHDPNLRQIRPAKGMYPESTINDQSTMPAVTRVPMVGAPNYGMAPQPMPSQHMSPLQMSPQHGGYGRPGATHLQGYMQQGYPPQGYQYSPGPMSAPPNAYPMHQQYGPGLGSLPPIATNGHYAGPQYGQPPHMQMSQPSPIMPFDQRPIRTSENHHPHQPMMPQYSSATPTSAAPAYMPQGLQPGHYAYPPQNVDRRSPTQQAAAALQIDPRLMMPVSAPVEQPNLPALPKVEPAVSEHRPQESIPTNGASNGGTGDATNASTNANHSTNTNGVTPTSAASQAPSIGALVNEPSPSDSDTNKKTAQTGGRDGSTTPGGTKENTAPQDIPSEKLGFREDKRALNALDKMFGAP